MPSVSVHPLTPDELPRLTDLVGSRIDPPRDAYASRRASLLAWIAFHNPMAKGEPTYFVATDGDRLVGHLGHMPMRFNIGGAPHAGYFIHDLYVHPDAREKGLGLSIANALYQAAEEASDEFCCYLGMTALNIEILRRRRHHETHTPRYARALSADAFACHVPGPLKKLAAPPLATAARVCDKLFAPRRTSIEIEEPPRFDERFDALFARIAPVAGISTYKTADFLNWKYVDGPMKTAKILTAVRDGELLGAAVLVTPRGTDRIAYIADIIAPLDEAAVTRALIAASLERFHHDKVNAVYCRSSHPRLARLLGRSFFLRTRQPETVVFSNLDKSPDVADLVKRAENWHLSYGESDGFMLAE